MEEESRCENRYRSSVKQQGHYVSPSVKLSAGAKPNQLQSPDLNTSILSYNDFERSIKGNVQKLRYMLTLGYLLSLVRLISNGKVGNHMQA